jgi:hypothetical protein
MRLKEKDGVESCGVCGKYPYIGKRTYRVEIPKKERCCPINEYDTYEGYEIYCCNSWHKVCKQGKTLEDAKRKWNDIWIKSIPEGMVGA